MNIEETHELLTKLYEHIDENCSIQQVLDVLKSQIKYKQALYDHIYEVGKIIKGEK